MVKLKSVVKSAACLLLCLAVATQSVSAKRPQKLPKEIKNLKEEQRANPFRTTLKIRDTVEADVYVKFKISDSGGAVRPKVVHCSVKGQCFEDVALEVVRQTAFDTSEQSLSPGADRYYHLVQFRADPDWIPGIDDSLVIDTTCRGLWDQYLLPEVICEGVPSYPPQARLARVTGTVWVSVLVGKIGLVVEAAVCKSSGSTLLDAAAIAAAYKCKFKPCKAQGQAVECWASYKIGFTLDE